MVLAGEEKKEEYAKPLSTYIMASRLRIIIISRYTVCDGFLESVFYIVPLVTCQSVRRRDSGNVMDIDEVTSVVLKLATATSTESAAESPRWYKFASERQLAIMSIFLSGCMLSGKLPRTLMHVVIIPLPKCKSKDPADANNYRPIAIATALSKVQLSRSFCRDSPGTCGLQTANLVSSEHMGHKWPYLHSSKQ